MGFAPLAEQGKKVREALIESLVLEAEGPGNVTPSTRDSAAGSGVRVLRVELADFAYAFNIQYLSQEGGGVNKPRTGSCVCLHSKTQWPMDLLGLPPATGGSDAHRVLGAVHRGSSHCQQAGGDHL